MLDCRPVGYGLFCSRAGKRCATSKRGWAGVVSFLAAYTERVFIRVVYDSITSWYATNVLSWKSIECRVASVLGDTEVQVGENGWESGTKIGWPKPFILFTLSKCQVRGESWTLEHRKHHTRSDARHLAGLYEVRLGGLPFCGPSMAYQNNTLLRTYTGVVSPQLLQTSAGT
ncbi:hypothetical protein VTK73DRAFT_1992 [Phialemonium thermophilum]|uniref:Uncharacterized protein n=1 Tax=Phialemonium thermophilum TaxID=223376 RepID=A0ABR3VSQ5_9PEZI